MSFDVSWKKAIFSKSSLPGSTVPETVGHLHRHTGVIAVLPEGHTANIVFCQAVN